MTRNGLVETLELFERICNHRYFRNRKFILLLNKIDLFKEYLKQTPFTFLFGDNYIKGRNYNDFNLNKIMMQYLMD